MRANTLLFGFALLALTFAGCSGDFNVRQTEPIQVQIDGESEGTRLAASGDSDARESEFRIENPDDVEVVTVVVQVVKVVVEDDDERGDVDVGGDDADDGNGTGDGANESDDGAEPTVILVIIEDRDSGERLEERRIEATDDSAQAELNVNVKGKDNIVVVTQAVQGAADVTVSAKQGSATGSGDMEMDDDNTTTPRA